MQTMTQDAKLTSDTSMLSSTPALPAQAMLTRMCANLSHIYSSERDYKRMLTLMKLATAVSPTVSVPSQLWLFGVRLQ